MSIGVLSVEALLYRFSAADFCTLFQDNNLKTRRNLRGQIERRNLEINRDFLNAFKSVKESLDEIHNNVKGMSDSCKSMQVLSVQQGGCILEKKLLKSFFNSLAS